MITLPVLPKHLEAAEHLYSFYNLKNSITEGKSQIYGAVGEVIVMEYYSGVYVGCYDYDLKIKGYRVDVKTKRTSVKPKPHYLCSIAAPNTHQDCDYYYFVRVTMDLKTCYLLGYLPKDLFYKKAIFKKKGELDGASFQMKEDCYNVKVEDLWLKEKLRKSYISM